MFNKDFAGETVALAHSLLRLHTILIRTMEVTMYESISLHQVTALA